MKKLLLALALTSALCNPAFAANGPSGSPRIQGTPDGYGDPVQVTIVAADGSDTAGQVVGNIADGVADSGNAVRVGGVITDDNAGLSLRTAGTRYGINLDFWGNIRSQVHARGTTPVDAFNNNYIMMVNDAGTPANFGPLATQPFLWNGTSRDRVRSIITGNNSTGVGIAAAGIVAQGDDASIQAITENQFGNARMSLTNHALVVRPYETEANSWQYASGTTGILSNTTTAVTFKASAGAGLRNYITACQIGTTAFGAAVPIAIRDGAGGTVLWAATVPTAGWLTPLNIQFPSPIRGTAATLLEIVTTTANTTGTAMVNCQGFVAP